MNTKQIKITFVILLLSLFLVPMIIFQHGWGLQVGWPWGFFTFPIPPESNYFQWIWEVFLAFPSMDIMFYVALVATVGVVVDVVLLLLSMKAISHRWFTALTALLNIAFGVAAILVTAIHSSYSGSLVLSPLGIFLVICGGIAVFQIMRA